MKIIRVFPRKTSHTPKDDLVFIGDPPLERPDAGEVHISCTFTWDKKSCERLQKAWNQYYPIVRLGGPAYDDPGNGFTPGIYSRVGVVYTSRGCNNQCPWCLVNQREGRIREIPITDGNIEQSNNPLQCSHQHIDGMFDMLSHQRGVILTGLEAGLITERISDRIRSLRLNQLFIACDTPGRINKVRKAIKLLKLPRDKIRCYVLLKFDPKETIDIATGRMQEVWESGAMPFAQLYQPPDRYIQYSKEWKEFARKWSRPAIIKKIANKL